MLGFWEVQLADRDDHGAFEKAGIEALELIHEGIEVRDRVALGIGVDADHVQQHAGAFDMLQESKPQASSLGGALDDAWDVGDDKGPVDPERNDAEVRHQGGEWVVGHLGLRLRHGCDEGALADVWKAHDPDIGEELELEPDLSAHTGLAGLGTTRGSVVRRRELDVPAPAAAPLRGDELRTGLVEVGEESSAFVIVNLSSDRDLDPHVGAGFSELILAAPVLTTFGPDDLAESKVEESGHPVVSLKDQASAPAPVPSRRTSEGHELLPAKRDAAVAAIARHDFERRLVDEVHARHYVEGYLGATDFGLEQIRWMRTLHVSQFLPPDADPVPSEAEIIQALDLKALETIRLTESLSLDPESSGARAALTEHLTELCQMAADHGLLSLGASIQTALDQLREESFSSSSVQAARMLAHRYQELAQTPNRSGTHQVVAETIAIGETLESPALRGRRVVLADDDAEVRWLYVGVLREAGARVIEAADGVRALELARVAAPDLILADVLMPRLDGPALCAAVRREPSLDGVPIVLLSWRDDFLHRMRELRAGAQDYLRKELPAQQILDRLEAVLAPLTRFEKALTDGIEVRGDLEELGVPVLFRAIRRVRPDARVVLQDPWSLFEVELSGGHIVDVTRTAIDGTVNRGQPTLISLAGMTSGRFVVAAPLPAIEGDKASLEEDFESATRRLGELMAKLGDTPDCRVQLDAAALTTYVRHSPARIQRLIARLVEGAPPRALWEAGEGSRAVVVALLVALARRGAVIDVEIPREQDVREAPNALEPTLDPLERENFRAEWAVSMHREPANPVEGFSDTIWRYKVDPHPEDDDLLSGFGLETQVTPKIMGWGFVLVFCATVGFLVWQEATRGGERADTYSEPEPQPSIDTPPPKTKAVMPDSTQGARTGLSAYAGELRPGLPTSLAVPDGQGVLELRGSTDVTVQIDGIDRGSLPVTLALEEGRHAVRYGIGDVWTYRFYYVKAGATRVLHVSDARGGFVDAR